MNMRDGTKRKKRLVRGKDFDGWACMVKSTGLFNTGVVWSYKPTRQEHRLMRDLKWVRVKLVEVKR